jgi:hypothetical protein
MGLPAKLKSHPAEIMCTTREVAIAVNQIFADVVLWPEVITACIKLDHHPW